MVDPVKVAFDPASGGEIGYICVQSSSRQVTGFTIRAHTERAELDNLITLTAIGVKGQPVNARLELTAHHTRQLVEALKGMLDDLEQ